LNVPILLFVFMALMVTACSQPSLESTLTCDHAGTCNPRLDQVTCTHNGADYSYGQMCHQNCSDDQCDLLRCESDAHMATIDHSVTPPTSTPC